VSADLRRPEAVVLDLDGTLVDTVGTRITAWLRAFAEAGIPADASVVAELIGSDGRRLARKIGEAAGVSVTDADTEHIDARAGAIYSELNTDPQPLPGVIGLLDALDAAGIPWAIGTSSRRAQVGASVAALGRGGEIRIVDGSAVQHAKPHPELLLAAAAALEADPAGCWCIGDSRWDMEAAVAAGMVPIAVTAGSALGAQRLQDAGASLVVSTMDELIPLLG